jgi:hypothetical protein
MKEVDYAKLSGQYASFLVAVGGVSITVLTLVLGLSSAQSTLDTLTETGRNARVFLIAALIAATVSCFIGAHMMAETAAFFTHREKKELEEELPDEIPLGRRLFVLATSNIFIAITLVLFSIVLLPTATGEVGLAASLKLISLVVFLGVVLGALCWMALAAIDRMEVGDKGWRALAVAFVAGLLTGIFCYASKELWLQVTFIFIVGTSAASLLYFVIIFKVGGACTRRRGIREIAIFSSAITISYVFLGVAYFRILWGL